MSTMTDILAADIGGTNARFARFRVDDSGVPHCVARVTLATSSFASFAALLAGVASADPACDARMVQRCVFAIAGPVQGGVYCQPPNIAWHVNLADVTDWLPRGGALLINDFVAQGWACFAGAAQDLLWLQQAGEGTATHQDTHSAAEQLPTARASASMAVLGAGTGCGFCVVLPGGAGRAPCVLPSEGGHASFAFEGRAEADFAAFVRDRTGGRRVVFDTVLSGGGISLLHAFHYDETLSPREAAARFAPESPVVTWFARFYGRSCRDWALRTMALGGVRIAGGVAAANPLLVQHPAFMEAFGDCATHEHLLHHMGVALVRNTDAGLVGAAMCGFLQAR